MRVGGVAGMMMPTTMMIDDEVNECVCRPRQTTEDKRDSEEQSRMLVNVEC
jgi:hypothetical protein